MVVIPTIQIGIAKGLGEMEEMGEEEEMGEIVPQKDFWVLLILSP
jgi:hypothetical protein